MNEWGRRGKGGRIWFGLVWYGVGSEVVYNMAIIQSGYIYPAG